MKIGVLSILCLLLVSGILPAQEKKSRADVLYFEYAYRDAITEYLKESRKAPLTNQQQLNLAHAYLKTGRYDRAMESYLQVYKQDSTMSVHHFNDMLQAMARTSGMDRVKAFLATKESFLSAELLENADFNFELLARGEDSSAPTSLFNLGDNSPQADFAPSFYMDDRLLFTSARSLHAKQIYNPSGESFLDIYVARLKADGDILSAGVFTAMPDSEFHEGTPFYSGKLDKLFYILSNAEDGQLTFDNNGKNALAIGLADADGNFNYLLRDLGTSFYYPFYEEKSSKLYFAANFTNSYGGTDLYYVHTNNGLIMSAPVNLGPRINTPGNEIAPYIFEDSFYYASDIFYGLGGMDVYKATIQQDGSYSIPVNLGEGINSAEDDFGLIIRNDGSGGLVGYFASNRPGGKGNDDLYGFKVAEKPGLKTLVFRGRVINALSGNPVDKAAVAVRAPDGALLKEVYTGEDGAYRIEIPARDSVQLSSGKDRYSAYREVMGGSRLDSLQGATLDIALSLLDDLVRETEGQTVIKMDRFYFERNSARISPEIATELDKVVEAVKKFPALQLRIEAHTDSRGSKSSNFRLSQSRADAIKAYLQQEGVAPSNILYTMGFGEDKIINNCTDGVFCLEMLHKQNERHLIVILNYNQLFDAP